jgi:hypothetical protein
MPAVIVNALNRRGVVLGLMLVALGFGAWFGWSYAKTGASVGWKTSQFFFSYQELGFVSRGLVATLLHPFAFLLTASGLLTLTTVMVLGFGFTWWRWADGATQGLPAAERAVLLAVVTLAPSTLQRMGFDYGRFDPLNVLLLLAALACLRRSRDPAAGVLAAIAVLIHEGFLVLQFPVLCAWILAEGGGGRDGRVRWTRLARFLVLPGLTALAVVAWGRYEPGIDALVAHFAADPVYRAAAPGGTPNRDALLVITRTLRENWEFNAAFFAERHPWGHLALIGAWLAVFGAFFDRFYVRNGLRRDWLYFAAYSPLLISVIACDYFRWAALASINLLVVVFLKLADLRRDGRVAVIAWDIWAKLAVASCLLGPISNTKSFPFFFTLLEKTSPWRIPW